MAKCMKCGGAKMKSGGATKGGSNAKMGIFGMPQTGTTGVLSMKKGGSKVTAVKHSCPPGTVRMADGKCGTRETPSFKKGGNTKSLNKK